MSEKNANVYIIGCDNITDFVLKGPLNKSTPKSETKGSLRKACPWV